MCSVFFRKKYGTLLLNVVKRIGEKIKSDVIYLGAKDSNKDFYLKNGFIINKRYKPEKYDRLAQESEIDYDVDMKYTLNLVGGKIKKHKSTNKKRKYKSKTKRMT